MGLQQQLADDLKTSMKARDKERTGAIRMVISALKNKAVEEGLGPQGELSDDVVQKVIASEVKKRKDSATQYRDADRPELAEKEEAEAEIYATYLPTQLSDEELAAVVDGVIADSGASTMKDMGPTIKAVMGKVGGQAEGARVSALVKERLAG